MTGKVTSPPEAGEHRCADVQWGSWVRLSPRSEAGASLVYTGTDTAGQNAEAARMHRASTPVGSVARISRTWLQQGTGRLLTITRADGDEDARYVLDDGGELFTNPDDVGTVVLEDTGALVLTSSDDSRGCPDGSVASFPEVELRGTGGAHPPKPAPSLELAAEDAECGLHRGLGGTWVQVSS